MMTTHNNKQSDSHAGAHGHAHNKSGWKPHRDWRVLIVAVMLFAMVVYILTMDESIQPAGNGPAVPATPGPAAPASAP